MTDVCRNVRQDALAKILTARQQACSGSAGVIRHNIVPSIDFEARNYYEMIDWTEVAVTSPPVLIHMSDEELIEKLSGDELFEEWAFRKFPCHTVAVERSVKLVTEAALKVYGHDARERYIRSTLKSRESLPRFDTKADYVFPCSSESETE